MKQFSTFAQYNRWANQRLYEAAERLSEDDYKADRGVYFASLHGTLNHILVGDRIWMRRFTGSGPQPPALDDQPLDDLAGLIAARREEDERIIAYVEGLSEAELDAPLNYATLSNTPMRQPLHTALSHFFNHQTHHRGQAHAVLTITGGRDAAPPLDLLLFQRETGYGLEA